MWVKRLTKEEKEEIAAVCERFIADTLKPRFLPVIRPSKFNYRVDIFGRWRGNKYSFISRFRSGYLENPGNEFDHVEEHLAETRFNIMWHRDNGRWFRLHAAVSLEEALLLMLSDELLWP